MANQPDHYKVLGVSRTATEDEIKKAYRKLARELHPDVNKSEAAKARFQQVQDAYEVLSDPEQRRVYDRGGRPERSPFGAGGAGRGRGATYTWSNVGGRGGGRQGDFDESDLSDLFDELFSGGGSPFGGAPGPGAAAKARSRPVRGRDISRHIEAPFLTAAKGGVESVRVVRGGRAQTIEVTIPKGCASGKKLRIRGAGQPSQGTGPAGDLILVVKVGEHPVFRREGLDLVLDLPVTIAEATLGATVTAPTLDGAIELTVPAGSSSGRQLRVRGRGLTDERGEHGDLRAIVKIAAPTDLSESDREAIASIGARLPSPRTGPHWPA